MGSTGSGNFSDYSSNKTPQKNQGSKSTEDDCTKAYSLTLEDVERSEYFLANNSLPTEGTSVTIRHNIRLQAVETETNQSIGYLPTSFNFLLKCLSSGIVYQGEVISSIERPVSVVKIDIAPI
ncbi:hypothetical protein [Lacibacter sp. H407]|uniref:hypothetical protein n=1 Tax=Lacibacter sp. H407 TaxID=3133423 RepID=UPI0030C4BD14